MGPFFYYGVSLDGTILQVLKKTSLQKYKPAQQIKEKFQLLMDYLVTYTDAYIQHHDTDIQLHIDMDAAYVVFSKSRSRIPGFYHLTNTQHTSDIFLGMVQY